ncbi:hypothetical protein SBV1_10021 [Verrucomicrobia bacterium]|nr:hypothetical protein SBV1_10021 [Verrucomicrobiota bacterium]
MNPTPAAVPEVDNSLVQGQREDNKLRVSDRAAHDWYRFVLSFPAHLVRTFPCYAP